MSLTDNVESKIKILYEPNILIDDFRLFQPFFLQELKEMRYRLKYPWIKILLNMFYK